MFSSIFQIVYLFTDLDIYFSKHLFACFYLFTCFYLFLLPID